MGLLQINFNSTKKAKWYCKNSNNKYLLCPKRNRFKSNLNQKAHKKNKAKSVQEINNSMRHNKR